MDNTNSKDRPSWHAEVFQPLINQISDETEQKETMILIYNLLSLNNYINDYKAAISLHQILPQPENTLPRNDNRQEFLRERKLLDLWHNIAGRDAAMTIHHFAATLTVIRKSIKKAPTACTDADQERLTLAEDSMESEFPDNRITRNATAHRGEIAWSMKEIKKNADESGMLIFGKMIGDAYVCTFNGTPQNAHGKPRIVYLTTEHSEKLVSITETVYSAFPRISHLLPNPRQSA